MKTKILSIGNSFSADAQAYLQQMAETDGIELKTVNLYIGGCSLMQHCQNMESKEDCYEYYLNGVEDPKCMISLEEALLEDEWDVITIQQSSHDSGILESYYPYTEKLLDYVRTMRPNAAIWLHETWAYETDSDHELYVRYHNNQKEMYAALKKCYEQIRREFALPMIPAGDLIQALRETKEFDYQNGAPSLCRDGFHMSLSYGRYAVAALWYKILLNGNVMDNTFLPEKEALDMTAERVDVIKKMVEKFGSL